MKENGENRFSTEESACAKKRVIVLIQVELRKNEKVGSEEKCNSNRGIEGLARVDKEDLYNTSDPDFLLIMKFKKEGCILTP